MTRSVVVSGRNVIGKLFVMGGKSFTGITKAVLVKTINDQYGDQDIAEHQARPTQSKKPIQ